MRNKNRISSTKTPRPLIVVLAFTALLLFRQAVSAEGIITPQVFTRGNFVYVVEPQRIVFLSMDTRSSHTVYHAEDEIFNIVSAVQDGDMIWASSALGAVIAVNMQTGTVEEFSRGRVNAGGHIGAGRRFVWLAAHDTLYRMDQTSREWISLPVPNNGGEVRGLISFNDQVHVISERAVHVLTTASEDWAVIPHKNFTLTRGDFRNAGDAAYVTQERTLFRYSPSVRQWSSGTVKGHIRAVNLTSELPAAATDNRIYVFNADNLMLERQTTLPMLRGIRSLVLHNGSPVCATGQGLAFGAASPFNFSIVTYPGHIRMGKDVFAFSLSRHIILYTDGGFVLYHPERRLWSTARVAVRTGGIASKRLHGWSEEGLHINITENVHSSLRGGVTFRQQPGANNNNEAGELVVDPGISIANATVNIHTEDADGRILDLSVDNGATTVPPLKGLYYKGAEGDVFNRASFGVQNQQFTQGMVNPSVLTEGGAAVFTSAAKAPGSDRHFLSATAGSGYILSKTEWRTLGYQWSGVYRIENIIENAREVVPASVRMYIDGIPLPESDYIYSHADRTVRLLRREKSNPTSLIQISFSERRFPNDPFAFEPLPENHLGQYNFAEGAISPRSWLSARAGLMYIGSRDPALSLGPESGPVVTAGLPVELRGGANRSLLIHPEVAYDAVMGTHSAAVSAGVREGKTFGSYRGLWAGRDFHGTDRAAHTMAYRPISGEHEASLGYDLRSDLRASWYQLHRSTGEAGLSHFELRSSYTGDGYILPGINLSMSSRHIDYAAEDAAHSRNETFTLHLSDPASRFLAEANRFHSAGYEFSWTEYQNNGGQRGRTLYGQTSVSPISPLTVTGSWMYRNNPSDFHAREENTPTLSVSMRDLPQGFDINATQLLNITTYSDDVKNSAVIRDISTFFYPGEYTDALSHLALYLRYVSHTESQVPPVSSPLKYLFSTDSNTHYTHRIEEAGILYFPMENLLLSTLNTRSRDQYANAFYTSHERVKMWFDNSGGLEGNFYMNKRPNLLYLRADGMYEHSFQNGLLAGAGLVGVRHSEDFVVDLYGGPQFIISQTTDLKHNFFRNIEHSHYLQPLFHTSGMSKPDLLYNLYLRLKMPPNMSAVMEMWMEMKRMDKINGGAGAYLHAGF
ncbi:MAG: hypothetical protein FWB85_08095 [Chitinispirillia bacterium]|nr:hypothetical protein [Chitinispirillia bacterium]MCL2242269.1 hypothetical protein [Chitinispirillia bacterium]